MTPDPDIQPEFYEGVLTKRFFAWAVDAIVIALITVLVLPFTAFTGIFFFLPLMALVGFVYRVATLANRSATPGMRLFSMELRTGADQRFSLFTALAHTLGYYVSVAVAPLQLISVVLMCISARAQGLTDMLLDTVPMNRRRD